MNRKQLNNVVNAIKDIRDNITDDQAASAVYIYPEWKANGEYNANDRVRYGDTLYKCLTPHTAQETWTPVDAPSLWAKVLIPDENEIPVWEQPLSTNPYNKGDKVMYNGVVWMSTIDGNVWQPGVYGWQEV